MKPRSDIATTHRSRTYAFVRCDLASDNSVSTHVYRHLKSGRLWAHKAVHSEWSGHDDGDWFEIKRKRKAT